jgi:hypothetical protein
MTSTLAMSAPLMVCSAMARSSLEPEVIAVGLPSTRTVTWELPLTEIFPSGATDSSGVDCSTSWAVPLAALGILAAS